MSKKRFQVEVYSTPKCDEDTHEAILYVPTLKAFLETTKSYNYRNDMPEVKRISLKEKIMDLLSSGTNSASAALYMQIPDFKKEFNKIIKDIKPVFKEHDTVWYRNDMYNHKDEISFWTAGKAVGFKIDNSCNVSKEVITEYIKTGKTPKKEIHVIREFINNFNGHKEQKREKNYRPMEEYDAWQEAKKGISKIKKEFKTNKIFGGTIHFQGRVFTF